MSLLVSGSGILVQGTHFSEQFEDCASTDHRDAIRNPNESDEHKNIALSKYWHVCQPHEECGRWVATCGVRKMCRNRHSTWNSEKEYELRWQT